MVYVLWTGGILLTLFVLLVLWRYTSVARGARLRDAVLLEAIAPVAGKLEQGRQVSEQEVAALASRHELRPLLYQALEYFEQLALFPDEFLPAEAQAKANLVYWMMHPNEEGLPPEQIEIVEPVRRHVGGADATYYVMRYRMRSRDARGGVWLLGVSGPHAEGDAPYLGTGAFARGDKEGEVRPSELVDWFIGLTERKGA